MTGVTNQYILLKDAQTLVSLQRYILMQFYIIIIPRQNVTNQLDVL